MGERVFRPHRGIGIVVVVFFGWLFVLALAIAFPDPLRPVLDLFGFPGPSDDSTIVGLVIAAIAAVFIAAGANQALLRLRLTEDGLQLGRCRLAWTEVDDFEQVWFNTIRVTFFPGRELGRRQKLTVALGKLGVYGAPAYLHTWFDTDGEKLIIILRRYRLTYGR
jgi:hypothetical protein